MEWYVPAAILPKDLQRSLNIVNEFLRTPFDLGGKKAKELLSKKARRRRRARRSPSNSDSDLDLDTFEPGQKKKRGKKKKENSDADSDASESAKKKRAKKKKEKEHYKSAQFIEDSDEEYGDMDAFLEKEKQLREKMIAKAATGAGPMKSTGTKKRKKDKDGERGGKKRRKGDSADGVDGEERPAESGTDVGATDEPQVIEAPELRPRPRPRPVKPPAKLPAQDSGGHRPVAANASAREGTPISDAGDTGTEHKAKRKSRVVVISDDDD